MATLSGLHATTPQHLQLDAGVLLANVGVGPDATKELENLLKGNGLENKSEFEKVILKRTLGATKGGAVFTAVPEMRNLLDGVNGSRGNYKDGAVIDTWDISLKTTVSEMTASNIGHALATISTENFPKGPEPTTTHTKQTGTVGRVKTNNYTNNIVWIGSMNQQEKPMVILIKNALNTNGMTFTASDKDSGSVELELKAHFTVANPEEVPFEIYIPKEGDV